MLFKLLQQKKTNKQERWRRTENKQKMMIRQEMMKFKNKKKRNRKIIFHRPGKYSGKKKILEYQFQNSPQFQFVFRGVKSRDMSTHNFGIISLEIQLFFLLFSISFKIFLLHSPSPLPQSKHSEWKTGIINGQC